MEIKSQPAKKVDTIIVGAGLGGLAAAALLQHRRPNETILVLEAHTRSGGCASSYDKFLKVDGYEEKQRFRLDVGATTLSGLGNGRPVQQLFDKLGLTVDAVQADPGIQVVLNDGTTIRRFADQAKWITESVRVFGEQTIPFWQEAKIIADRAWKISSKYQRFPFTSFADVVDGAKRFAISDIVVARQMLQPFESLLKRHNLENNIPFREFIDQMLMISVQCESREAGLLIGVLGLEYPSQTYYVNGGLYSLAIQLEKNIKDNGGDIQFKTKVERIDNNTNSGGFIVTDSKQRTYLAKRLISNATIWDSSTILGDVAEQIRSDFNKKSDKLSGTRWGALFLTGIIEDVIDDGGALYQQYHTHQGSLFLSLSRRGDLLRAPRGYRTFSVSTHEANPEKWFVLNKQEYDVAKMAALDFFESVLHKRLSGYGSAQKLMLEIATPRTFAFYTHRKNGWVGGIPHSRENALYKWNTNVTKLNNFFLVGDTVFPGQGTPGVVQSAINLVERISPIL